MKPAITFAGGYRSNYLLKNSLLDFRITPKMNKVLT